MSNLNYIIKKGKGLLEVIKEEGIQTTYNSSTLPSYKELKKMFAKMPPNVLNFLV